MLCLIGVVQADEYVGDRISSYLYVDCPGVILDDNMTDGSATYIYYRYSLTDPDDVVRFESGLQPYDKNFANVACIYDADKAGTWTCEAELIQEEIMWTGTEWVVSGGVCDSDTEEIVVLPTPICGNGILEDEECDDGNTANNDGCSQECKNEFCGDGIVQSSEECDSTPDCETDCTLTPPPQTVSFTLHQNVSSEEFILDDAYVRKIYLQTNPNDENFGSKRRLLVETKQSGDKTTRTYQKIDLTKIKANPNYAGSVTQAKLYMTTDGEVNGLDFGIYKVTNSWDEDTITWNNQPCGTNFNLCSGNTNIIDDTTLVQVSNGDWIWEIDITTLMNEALTEGDELSLAYKINNENLVSYYGRMMYGKEMTSFCLAYFGPWKQFFCRTHSKLEVTV
jgi:cysteine-rich repeat protein